MSLLHDSAHRVFTSGFYRTGWDHQVRAILGKSAHGGSSVGEVLATIDAVKPGEQMEWFTAWLTVGQRIAAQAQQSQQAGRSVSASSAFLRAANYLAVAVASIDGTGAEDSLTQVFSEHRAAWEGFVSTQPWPVDRIDIAYEGSSMPGWLFRPVSDNAPRRTLVVVNGSDGAISGLWSEGAAAALERGWNVLLFDGPGQQSMLFERDVPARPDWEAVLTPVVDTLVERPDVDELRLAVLGISQAGYWVPRALTQEKRFAAAVVDGGVVSVPDAWLRNLPASMQKVYLKGDNDAFDKDMEIGLHLPGGAAVKRLWAFRARPFGVTHGYAAVLDAVSHYTLDGITDQITTPLLITDPEDEDFFPGQSRRLAQAVPTAKLMPFTAAEGASGHCQPLARELTEERVFDWLDDHISQD